MFLVVAANPSNEHRRLLSYVSPTIAIDAGCFGYFAAILVPIFHLHSFTHPFSSAFYLPYSIFHFPFPISRFPFSILHDGRHRENRLPSIYHLIFAYENSLWLLPQTDTIFFRAHASICLCNMQHLHLAFQ